MVLLMEKSVLLINGKENAQNLNSVKIWLQMHAQIIFHNVYLIKQQINAKNMLVSNRYYIFYYTLVKFYLSY